MFLKVLLISQFMNSHHFPILIENIASIKYYNKFHKALWFSAFVFLLLVKNSLVKENKQN
jgi:hypothetical protein